MNIETKESCNFCVPTAKARPHFAEYGVARLDMTVLLETDHLKVIPDILPVSPDGLHMLLVPKTHGFSFAALPDLSHETGNALHRLEQMVGEPLAFFEHGGTDEGGNNQSVYHQHAHIIATHGFDYIRYMEDALHEKGIVFDVIETPDSSPIVNLQDYFRGENYIYIQQGKTGIILHDPDNALPSQITQKSVSRLLNHRELDWKKIPENEEFAKLSIQRIIALIERCSR